MLETLATPEEEEPYARWIIEATDTIYRGPTAVQNLLRDGQEALDQNGRSYHVGIYSARQRGG